MDHGPPAYMTTQPRRGPDRSCWDCRHFDHWIFTDSAWCVREGRGQWQSQARYGCCFWRAASDEQLLARYIPSMCSHYEQIRDGRLFRAEFGVDLPEFPFPMETHIWPWLEAPFIRLDKAGAREVMSGVFSLIPHWTERVNRKLSTFNARVETIAEKPTYRSSWRLGRRCIIPCAAIYEPDWTSGHSIPTRIARADGRPLAVAGVWDAWEQPNDIQRVIVRSFAMLTRNADDNPLFRRFHAPDKEKRMVGLLRTEQYEEWLHCAPERAAQMIASANADPDLLVTEQRPVSRER